MREMETFGERLRRLRQEAGLSQTYIEHSFHLAHNTLHEYEQDIHSPGLWNLIRLARLLHVSMDYLCLGREYEGPRRDEEVQEADEVSP